MLGWFEHILGRVTAVAHHRHQGLIYKRSLVESFVGLLQRLMILEASEWFVDVNARFRGVLIPNSNVDTDQQGMTTNALEGHQMTVIVSPIGLYAHERSFALARHKMEASRCENSAFSS